MNQFNYPTIILSGEGALKEFSHRLKNKNHRKVLIVTDNTLDEAGLVQIITMHLSSHGIDYAIFSDVNPNPDDLDVENGLQVYRNGECDSIIALGGGSPMDVAKVIKIMVSNPPPLSQYDDTLGGDMLIKNAMPRLYAIPTTAGTGSEVGRSGVIIMRETGKKTIFFHPDLMPDIAVLEPEMTVGLPKHITAATGIDAFSHCLEAYFSTGFHPMADGIALQGIELILDCLPIAYNKGSNIMARERMQIAATMGATAFQKGLGMIHSLAHPLSGLFGMHHGLAITLMLPDSVDFLEKSDIGREQIRKILKVKSIFAERDLDKGSLALSCRDFFESLGIGFGLSGYNISESDLANASQEAFQDPCHSGNMIPISQNDLLGIYQAAY